MAYNVVSKNTIAFQCLKLLGIGNISPFIYNVAMPIMLLL